MKRIVLVMPFFMAGCAVYKLDENLPSNEATTLTPISYQNSDISIHEVNSIKVPHKYRHFSVEAPQGLSTIDLTCFSQTAPRYNRPTYISKLNFKISFNTEVDKDYFIIPKTIYETRKQRSYTGFVDCNTYTNICTRPTSVKKAIIPHCQVQVWEQADGPRKKIEFNFLK